MVVLHERAREGERIWELRRVELGQGSVHPHGHAGAHLVQPGVVNHGPERVGDESAHDTHRGHAVETGRPRGRERELKRTKTSMRVELTHDHDVDAARVPARDLAEGPDQRPRLVTPVRLRNSRELQVRHNIFGDRVKKRGLVRYVIVKGHDPVTQFGGDPAHGKRVLALPLD